MSNKLEINRDRLFTDGYRKYLQSLTHGALVDFILRGSNLSFTPAQERSLLLEELADEQARHERATKKINSLVHENRGLREQLDALQPVDTSGSFDSDAEPVELTARFKIVDLETNNVLYEGNIPASSEDDFAKNLFSLIFDGLTTGDVETKRVYTSAAEYLEDYPDAVTYITAGAVGTILTACQIDACEELLHQFDPYTEVGSASGVISFVQIALPNDAVGEDFTSKARELGINPVTFATFLVNHCN